MGVEGWGEGERSVGVRRDGRCTEVDGYFRVRLGMADPGGVHGIREGMADVFARHDQLYNFIHAPVQSGSDAVLEDMRRQHRVEKFREIVATFDDRLDHWTLSTDFIVGFPTETPEDHERSMELFREVRPEKANGTRFSRRPGTDAADRKGLGGQVKKDRWKEMSELKREAAAEAYRSMIGDTKEVLAVRAGTGDSMKCRDDAYRQIIVRDADERGIQPGDVFEAEVTSHQTVYAFGEPVAAAEGSQTGPSASITTN